MYGSPEVTAGGNALKYYASVRLDTRRKEILPDNTGIRIKVKVVKNKVAPPFKAVQLDILFGSGLDRYGCMLDAALDLGIIERKGSWYAYQGTNVAQGRASVVELLKQPDSDFGKQLEEQVRQALSSDVGAQADVEASAVNEEENDGIGEAPAISGMMMMETADDLFMEA
jgi:recombination protein RecA